VTYLKAVLAGFEEKNSFLEPFAVEICPQWNIFITAKVGNDSTANPVVLFLLISRDSEVFDFQRSEKNIAVF
jgi:hypothetical protein